MSTKPLTYFDSNYSDSSAYVDNLKLDNNSLQTMTVKDLGVWFDLKLNWWGFQSQGYADDLIIIMQNKLTTTESECMQEALNFVARWCKRTGLSLDPNKTEVILFTKQRRHRSDLISIFLTTLLKKEIVAFIIKKATIVLFTC